MNSGQPLLHIHPPENYQGHQEKSRIQCLQPGMEKLHPRLQEWNHRGPHLQFKYWDLVLLIFLQCL